MNRIYITDNEEFHKEMQKEYEELIPTEEEEKSSEHCVDWCPIYDAIELYNGSHFHRIHCTTEMCQNMLKTHLLNERLEAEYNKKEQNNGGN